MTTGRVPVRALKILVVVMGIMLVVGFATLVVVIAGRISRSGHPPATARLFGERAIEIPRRARIEAMAATGDRLVLGLELPDGNRQLVIIDLASGTRLGAIDLHPAP